MLDFVRVLWSGLPLPGSSRTRNAGGQTESNARSARRVTRRVRPGARYALVRFFEYHLDPLLLTFLATRWPARWLSEAACLGPAIDVRRDSACTVLVRAERLNGRQRRRWVADGCDRREGRGRFACRFGDGPSRRRGKLRRASRRGRARGRVRGDPPEPLTVSQFESAGGKGGYRTYRLRQLVPLLSAEVGHRRHESGIPGCIIMHRPPQRVNCTFFAVLTERLVCTPAPGGLRCRHGQHRSTAGRAA